MIILDNIIHAFNNQEFPINMDNFITSQTNNVLDILFNTQSSQIRFYVMPNRKET